MRKLGLIEIFKCCPGITDFERGEPDSYLTESKAQSSN